MEIANDGQAVKFVAGLQNVVKVLAGHVEIHGSQQLYQAACDGVQAVAVLRHFDGGRHVVVVEVREQLGNKALV